MTTHAKWIYHVKSGNDIKLYNENMPFFEKADSAGIIQIPGHLRRFSNRQLERLLMDAEKNKYHLDNVFYSMFSISANGLLNSEMFKSVYDSQMKQHSKKGGSLSLVSNLQHLKDFEGAPMTGQDNLSLQRLEVMQADAREATRRREETQRLQQNH